MYNIQGQKSRIKRQVYTTQRQQKYTKTGVLTHNTPYTKTGIRQRQMNEWMIHGYRKGVYKDRYTIKWIQKQALYKDK